MWALNDTPLILHHLQIVSLQSFPQYCPRDITNCSRRHMNFYKTNWTTTG